MQSYNHRKIESKWQRIWAGKKFFESIDFDKKPKQYILVEFPYPSGEGLHVGHCRPFVALDIIARKRRMEGFNVLYPIGWDAFGLPTENYALKTGIHPAVATKKNTDTFRRQLKSIGFSFDWSREINTTDPKYYKWTQWIFLQLYKNGLAYKAKMPINFCASCKIGLANEEVVNGKCERCGTVVSKKEMAQWMLKITKYADRLINDLDKVDYQEKIKKQQINWIGRSEGVEIVFKIKDTSQAINVFTTRPDTLFGATYMVLSPEYKLIGKLESRIKNYKDVKTYIEQARNKSDLERTNEKKEKTGVELKGIKTLNPINNEEIPIFVADYVLPNYGTGAIMAVPAHDQRDYEFAKKYNLPIIEVISSSCHSVLDTESINKIDSRFRGNDKSNEAYTGEGILVNSDKFSGLSSKEAIKKITSWLEKNKLGKKSTNYKLRDWVFSRQHYWGEPIPIVYCKKCGEVPVPEKDLPVELPMVEKYQPTDTGESPLANIKDWVETTCPKCGGPAKRETDTMPNWAGSSWYYLRYLDPHNDKALADRKKIDYFMPVDLYNGGMEHTTLHLLYSRFWYKFLYDIKVVPTNEPYQKRTSHGMVLGEGGIKMSKSRGNVINPDEIIKKYGADTLRLYEMFIGPFGERVAWDTKGILGAKRFLNRVWIVFCRNIKYGLKNGQNPNHKRQFIINKTVQKVNKDIESMNFNTAISSLMECFNYDEDLPKDIPEHEKSKRWSYKNDAERFLLILSPFAPHLCEELWLKLKNQDSVLKQNWPKVNKRHLAEEKITIAIQVNGKLRDTIEIKTGTLEKEIIKIAKIAPNAKNYLVSKDIKKTIYIKDRIVNFVI